MTTTVRVVYSANDSFVAPLAAAVRSLLDSCRPETRVELAILSSGISTNNRKLLIESWTSFQLASVTFFEIDSGVFDELPGQTDSNAAALRAIYGRLLAPRMLPATWERVLYLDGDTILRTDVSPLYSWDLAGHPVAARRDPIITEMGHPGGLPWCDELGIDPRLPYFNSGVMVLDLVAWRQQSIGEKVLDFSYAQSPRVNLHDQAGLNGVLRGDFSELPWVWNTITLIGRDRIPRPVGQDLAEQANVLHFVGELKPWMSGGESLPGASHFRQALERTSWAVRSSQNS